MGVSTLIWSCLMLKHTISFAVMFGLLSSISHANLLINGSFENPGSTAFNYYNNGQVPGWNVETAQVMEVGVASAYGVTGSDQRCVTELDSTSNVSLSQSISLSAGTYDLGFLYARRGTNMLNLPANTADFSVLWNNQLVSFFTPIDSAMQSKHFFVNAVQGMNKLTFRAEGPSDGFGAIIDNASLETVPEPASIAGLMIAGLGLARRRLKNS